METNMITQNINSTVPLTSHTQETSGGSSQKVQKNESAVLHKDKDAAVVSLSQALDAKKSGIFENISAINNVFAITQIAQRGLDDQEEIINKMRDVIETDSSQKNVSDKKNDLINLVKDFNQSIQKTTYNNEMLLTTQKSFDEITFSTQSDTFFVQTPDMQKSMENIAKLAVSYDGSDETNEKLIKELDNTLTNIASFSDTYTNLQNTVRSNSMQSMFANMDTSAFASNTLFMDYGRDVTDFNKTNITSQLGYLAAAQANILQEQSSRLLV